MPIVRRKLKYAELIRDIRLNQVREVAFFDNNNAPQDQIGPSNLQLEGFCLVVYHDDRVAQVSHLLPGNAK